MWKCTECDAQLNPPVEVCPNGAHKTGIPSNVWLAGLDEPKLNERFELCLNQIDEDIRKARLENYERELSEHLSVSINLRASSLINFLSDERIRFVNLHDNLRADAIPDYDKELANKRMVIDGMAFKSDGPKLNLGAVNLGSNTGLISYGEVCIILKSAQIKDRASFLENNSFSYYHESGAEISFHIPAGSRALWHSMFELAIVKHKNDLFGSDELTLEQISNLLLESTGDKNTDRFIEVQIFPPIMRATIHKVIVNMKAWRKSADKNGLIGKTEQHLQELSERALTFVKYFADEVNAELTDVELEVVK